MSVTPCACSVAAAVTMMKYATKFEKVMPTTVSVLMRDSLALARATRALRNGNRRNCDEQQNGQNAQRWSHLDVSWM